jgi:putative hydrolase of the HAD superfamily
MPAYRAVLFDFFGTLTHAVQRGPDHARIARILDRSFYLRARGRFGSAEATLRWVCAEAGADPTREQVRDALAWRVAAIRRDTELRRDAVPALGRLRREGLRTAVVSDCGYELPAILPTLPVAPLLDARVYSVQEGVCKPDPRIYLAACDRLDVRPDECLYIGDGGSQELTGAAELGMTAIRLAAPDLAGHLVFNADVAWTGRRADSLVEAARLAHEAVLA